VLIPAKQIAGGAGTPAWTDVTVDLGASRRSGTFDITAVGLTPGKFVDIRQNAKPIAAKGNATDEGEMDQILVTAGVLNSTTIRAYWNVASGAVVVGPYNFSYLVSG
jgi:hypothetical protein